MSCETFANFAYDGLLLSDFGFVVCTFNGTDLNTVSLGSKITFNTVPILHGNKHLLTHSSYDECLEAPFQICKNPCYSNAHIEPVGYEESCKIMRWLNREDFNKFKPILNGYEKVYFEGSFNVDKIELDGQTVGFDLTFKSNRPFALHEPVAYKFEIDTGKSKKIYDISDKIGYIYADTVITCKADGDLVIHNSNENRDTVIKNCKSGEIIHMDFPVISSSVSSHKVQNDFNFNFLRISNSFTNRENKLTFSLPCTVKITYIPIRKAGL